MSGKRRRGRYKATNLRKRTTGRRDILMRTRRATILGKRLSHSRDGRERYCRTSIGSVSLYRTSPDLMWEARFWPHGHGGYAIVLTVDSDPDRAAADADSRLRQIIRAVLRAGGDK